MPIGSYSTHMHIIDQLVKHQPKMILDLGIGFGIMGAHIRQWLDGGMKPWRTELLIGVEAFQQYASPAWQLYDGVFVAPIEEFIKTKQPQFDAIILSDVIEHFEKEQGFKILNKCLEFLNDKGILLVGTPAIFIEQGAAHGNEYERHKSLWQLSDFDLVEAKYSEGMVVKNGQPDEFNHQMILVKYTK